MIPHTYPNNLNPFSDMSQCVITYLSSVSGMTAWTDYIPVRTVSATGNIEGRTEATGYQAVYVLTVLTNKTAWIDYIPVYEDGTKTVAWSTDANGYIPIGISEAGAEQILSEADFQADLTHSLVLDAGTGSPTFTRATTGTVQDNEGILRTAIAGEARFTGARRVRNLLPSTEGAFDAGSGWTLLNGAITTGVEDPNGGSTAYTLTQSGAPSCELYPTTPFVNSSTISSVWIRRRTGTGTIRLYGGDYITNITSQVTSEWNRVTSNASESATVGFDLRTFDSGDAIDFWHPQAEDITGRTDQTTPSEYVSVGVLSAPYHGAGVDGVKYFDTDLSGNPIAASTLKGYLAEPAATNLCLQSNTFKTTWTDSTGVLPAAADVIGPDGTISAWTMTDNSAGAIEYITQNITLTAAAYTFSAFVKKTSGATTFPLLYVVTGTVGAQATIDTNNGVATVWTAITGHTMLAGASARCNSHDANFWRVELTYTATAALYGHFIVPAATTNATQSTGAVDVTVQGSSVWTRAQVELGSAATSYIPTTTVAVARNADVESVPTSGNITASAGWIAITYTPTHAPSGTVFIWGTYVDASNYTAILHDATNLIFRKRISGVNYDATIANSFVSGTTYKVAATWGTSGTGIALNGTLGTGHANTTAAQIGSTMQTGADGNSANQPGMSLGNERIGQRQLSSSELQAITR